MFLIRIKKKQEKKTVMTIFWQNGNNYEIDPKILLPFLPKGVRA
jgi:hypothetical protein